MRYTEFDQVFDLSLKSPYDRKTCQDIEAARSNFDGVLFIDRVLKALGITKAKVYPPKSEQALRSLHLQICEGGMSTHHKLSVFYYLLLDYDAAASGPSSGGKGALADRFAARSGVPEKYQTFMMGLWYLDRQQFELALANLTHPTLLPEFADDVLAVLAQKSPSPCLALAYYHALTPVLRTARSLRLLFASLVSTNVAEAFWFSRTFDDGTTGRDTAANGTRRQLFESLIDGVLGGEGAEGEYVRHASQQQHQVRKSTAASGAGRYAKGSSGTSAQSGHHDESEVADEEQDAQRAASRAAELVGLPLDSDEEAWFEDYLLRGDGRRLPRARDAVLARRALTRRLVPAMGGAGAGTGERLPTATMPGRWGTLVEGLRAATAGVAGQGRDGR